jgi:hypothetical protein
MWLQTIKFIATKSKCASLAQEIGFSAANSCNLLRMVKSATPLCTSQKECNKLDLTAAQYFWLVQVVGQSEPAPTSAPMWMDGALMGAPFSSIPVPGLTKVANSSWPCFFSFPQPRLVFFGNFFFLHPSRPPRSHLLPMHPGLLSPPPTYLPTYPPIYLRSHQPIYLCTYTLNLHQGNDDAGRWRYCNISDMFLHPPSYLPTRPCNFMTTKNNVAMTQLKVLQLN